MRLNVALKKKVSQSGDFREVVPPPYHTGTGISYTVGLQLTSNIARLFLQQVDKVNFMYFHFSKQWSA